MEMELVWAFEARRLVLLGTLVAVTTACSGVEKRNEAVSQKQSRPTAPRTSAGPPIDWEQPFSNLGVTFPTVEEANAVLPFKIVVPNLPGPDLIRTISPEVAAMRDRVVALVYHLPAPGTVWVAESLPGGKNVEWLKKFVAARANDPWRDPEAPPAYQMVPLRGTEGMLVKGNGVGRIIWIENGILFDITGPTVSPEQVMAIAQEIPSDRG